jgi:hypothetical protein
MFCVTRSQEPCPSPMQASMLLERNPSLVPIENLAKLEEKLGADGCNLQLEEVKV